MRYEITDRVLQLALELQGSRIGLSLGDIQERFRVSRRTAQRMRDVILRNYPQTEQLTDDERRPRWRIPVSGVVAPGSVSADELADLEAAVKLLRRENQRRRADAVESVIRKIRASMPADVARRIEPDLEALVEAEGLALRPGPRPLIRPELIDSIRLAIKQGHELYVTYRSRHTGKTSGRRLQPYGFIFGNRHYLVGVSPERHPDQLRMFDLSKIKLAKITARAFQRDPRISLAKFSARAFGLFQEEPRDVAWRFAPEAAEAAAEYIFHPTQAMERQSDGSLIVRFHAGGLLEMCWHLYTWGASVEVLAPAELKSMMRTAHRHRAFKIDSD